MVPREQLICSSSVLREGGAGVRFEVVWRGAVEPAFAVRYRGNVRAFLNRCAHVPVELDWERGNFFDLTKHYLVCAVHGAHYEPVSGRCALGPCRGASLVVLAAHERDGKVYVAESNEL